MAAKSPPENKFGSFNNESFEAPEEAFISCSYQMSSVAQGSTEIRSLEFSLCGSYNKFSSRGQDGG